MRRFICWLRGHQNIPVRERGLVARPGGMLPVLDGIMTYEPHPDGEHRGCLRCGRVTEATS